MMQQYHQAKAACPDAILLFRMGDFYELFHDDAKAAAKLLGLTLTSRDKSENPIPMAGFPHHQLDSYLAKLVRAGKRVAVCEQVEDPKTAKGIVRREITQVVSPGTVTDPASLEPGQCNFLACLISHRTDNRQPETPDVKNVGVSWVDLSTGAFAAATLSRQQAIDLLERINPSEILLPENPEPADLELAQVKSVTQRPRWSFAPERSRETVQKKFGLATMEGLGFGEQDKPAISAAGAIIEYLRETQSGSLDHLITLQAWRSEGFAEIDQATWRSLEVTRTLRSGNRDGSLLGVIDHCSTPMGSRMLGQWLTEPLIDTDSINRRLDAVTEFAGDSRLRSDIRERLGRIFDLERLIARIVTLRSSPRDFRQIGRTLTELPGVKTKLASRSSRELVQLEADLDLCTELRSELEQAISADCPPTTANGGFINDGYSRELDELRDLARGGKQWIAQYQQKISEETGISSLKVGFNKVFGYYLEVTNLHQAKVPDNFIRKQTLKNVERYITPELKEYEEKVLAADHQAIEVELRLFNQLRELASQNAPRLIGVAQVLARVDVYAGLAELAVRQKYCRPEVVAAPILAIDSGRHPVLDIIQPLGAFVPNNTSMSDEDGMIHLITGPNMAGKSTYIRQVALLTLMAQIGSYVPAKSASIGVADRIFARVGASDELSRGQSTFMVEMTETARILNTATERSLIILDEIGRGTSTYDGVSLAWAIAEFLHEHAACRTLFATHYHELTRLADTFPGIRNYNVSIREWEEKIVFLHKIVPGSADKSYGIHVARLAGVPDWVNRRAQQILDNLENTESSSEAHDRTQNATSRGSGKPEIQMTLFEIADHPLLEKIRRIDTNHLTPITALKTISDWQEELRPAEKSSARGATKSEQIKNQIS